MGKKRRVYTREFKRDALRLIAEGRSVADVARGLGVHVNTLHVTQWLASRPGVRVLRDQVFEIFFPGLSAAEACYSDEEQYVAEDVLEGADGSFALALELLGIEEESLRRLGARGLK